MRRRLLPILSVACLALAGVLACGYFLRASFFYTAATTLGGTPAERSFSLEIRYGSLVLERSTEPFNATDHMGINFDELGVGVARDLLRKSLFKFEAIHDEYSQNLIIESLTCPLWSPIVALLLPALIWWRRRKRERANVPGFPISTATEPAR